MGSIALSVNVSLLWESGIGTNTRDARHFQQRFDLCVAPPK